MKTCVHKCPLVTKARKGPQVKLDITDTTMLTAHDGCPLQNLCKVLTPLEEATDSTQGQTIVTSSYVVSCVIGFKGALNNMPSRYNICLVTSLKKFAKNRLTQFDSGLGFRLSVALDSRFMLQYCVPGSEPDIDTRTLLKAEIKSVSCYINMLY